MKLSLPAAIAVATTTVCVHLGLDGARAADPAFSQEAVAKAIKKGMDYLWARQQGDGSWANPGSGGLQVEGIDRQIGASSLITYSLMASGAKVNDPKIVKALEWLGKQKSGWNYALSLRSQAWLEAAKQDEQYKKQLYRDGAHLIRAGGRGPKPIGSYGYRVDLDRGNSLRDHDLSNGQYGVLGVWAAYQFNAEVPKQYWAAVMKYWLSQQQRDGGWKYNRGDKASTGTMTSAGLATLFVCVDALMSSRFVRCQRSADIALLRKPLDWFDRNFPASLRNESLCHGGHGDMYYYLFGVEREGLASGYKFFGKIDWYKLGARWLLGQQQGNGSWQGKWGPTPATAYALLFLARGQHAVLFNRLEYRGDWNNRPRALANFCRWARKTFEQDVYWQIINLKVDVSQWHDAPVLVISGSTKPDFSDDDIRRLREYVYQGGTILSVTECNGKGFNEGIREVYKKVFGGRELTALPDDHPIYTVNARLGGKPPLWAITNGPRPLAIHTDEDLCVDWQVNRYLSKRASFDAAANIVMYVTGKQMRRRGEIHWPPAPGEVSGPTVKLARLRYEGNYDPEPLAWERVSRRIAADRKIRLEVGKPIAIGELAGSGAGLAVLTGTGAVKLSDDDKKALKAYVAGGGLLLIDAAGGISGAGKEFARSARELVYELFGRRSLRTLAGSSALYRIPGSEISSFRYHQKTRLRLGGRPPALKGVLMEDGRIGVLLSREDLTVALIGCSPVGCDGYRPDSAYEIARNVVLYAAGRAKKR